MFTTSPAANEMICYCMGVDSKTIVKAIKDEYTTLKDIRVHTAACTGDECATMNPSGKCCSKDIKILISKHSGAMNLHKNFIK